MKTLTLRSAALAAALVALAACGRTQVPDDPSGTGCDPATSSSAASTTSASSSSGSSSTSSTGTGGAALTTSSSSSTSSTGGSGGGTGGSPPAFVAQCSGLLDCPRLPGCVQWDYAITDDGTSSAATASITVMMPSPLPPCMAQATFDDADAGPGATDPVEVPCGAQTWTLALDRASMTVYIKEDPAGLSWTPSCQ